MTSGECLFCGKELSGRAGKKFCDNQCKSHYHYEKGKTKGGSLFQRIDQQLKINRRLLKEHNKAGKTTLRKQTLLDLGFDPNFFTHYWKAKNGNIYFFCYEYGFMPTKKENTEKYVLVQWQEYMEK
ncbi:hypothetical protein R9C00_10110 [Flammeovirgaceae bacterium SG7u.111]|nr:hypothetical protein [Flammeovirgaceae bacterium SG7u.132]WPO37806.1 hypothetical protein R9C00_10110 [Flammeovirgaceae bacterium SG7u.111]